MIQGDDTRHRDRIRCADAASRMLVEAGPGTGKTEMAALRMAALISSGLSPGKILVLSFSRSAVRTLTHRLSSVTGTEEVILEELRHVSIRTFDSWTFRILRRLGHPVPDLLTRSHDDNIAELTRQIKGPQKDQIRELIGDRRHLIVDEFQDLPGVRGDLVLTLMSLIAPPGCPGTGFTVLGDPAQAIYGFAGKGSDQAFPSPSEYWKRIVDNYGSDLEELTLSRNYRAAPPLAEISASLRKVLLSERPDEEKLRIVRKAVAVLPSANCPVGPEWLDGDNSGSRAILTHTNGQAIAVLKKLFGTDEGGRDTPVLLRAGHHSSLSPAWIAALLRRLQSPELTRSQFSDIYDYLACQWDESTQANLGLPSKEATWSRLARASGVSEKTDVIRIPDLRTRMHWPDAFPDDQWDINDGVTVTTIHQSKGQEFDIVTLLDTAREESEQGATDSAEAKGIYSEEENVKYVAVTRAGLELNRIDDKELYSIPRNWKFRDGRERLCSWQNRWINMEIGLAGDLDPFGFVDPTLHGGTDRVESFQELLLRKAHTLEGHKVMLCKHTSGPKKVVWHIHLQESSRPGLLIGRTAPQLTIDLLKILYKKGYALPPRIMNLRISSVGTLSSQAEFPLGEPEQTSRLWLGFSLFGTGDFKPRK